MKKVTNEEIRASLAKRGTMNYIEWTLADDSKVEEITNCYNFANVEDGGIELEMFLDSWIYVECKRMANSFRERYEASLPKEVTKARASYSIGKRGRGLTITLLKNPQSTETVTVGLPSDILHYLENWESDCPNNPYTLKELYEDIENAMDIISGNEETGRFRSEYQSYKRWMEKNKMDALKWIKEVPAPAPAIEEPEVEAMPEIEAVQEIAATTERPMNYQLLKIIDEVVGVENQEMKMFDRVVVHKLHESNDGVTAVQLVEYNDIEAISPRKAFDSVLNRFKDMDWDSAVVFKRKDEQIWDTWTFRKEGLKSRLKA